MVTEHPIGRPLAGRHGKQRLAHHARHGHVTHLMRLRRDLRPFAADSRDVAPHVDSMSSIVNVLHLQAAHLAPTQAAQAKHQHERLAVGRLDTRPACFVRDGQQLLDGEVPVQSSALTSGQREFVGRRVGDEPVLDGEIADSFEHADDLEHRGRCQFSALPLIKACNSLCVMEPICRAAYSGSTCVFQVISSVRMVFGLRIGRRESIHSA